jgi:L-ascorbate metabolism protein UlaG (beta-lactamase superfamily)
MKLIGEEGVDLAVLPIGDNYTMGPDDALRAVKLLEPKFVLPIHFNTWELIHQDVNEWAQRVEQETNCRAVVLQPGGSFTLP